MKLVVISDTHLHPWKAYSEGKGANNTRLARTLDVIGNSLELARKLDCPWIHGGDHIHSIGFVENSVLNALVQKLSDYPDVPKYSVNGNHDSRGTGSRIELDESIISNLARSVPNFHVLEEETVELDEGVTLYGAGYQPNPDLINLGDGATIGLFHQTIAGFELESGHKLTHGLSRTELYKRYDLTISGHIHIPKQWDHKGKYVLSPGAPEQHNHGDKGDRGFWIVDIDKDGVNKLKFFNTNSPKFISVQSVDEIEDDFNYYKVLTPSSDEIPDNAKVSISPKTAVQQRNELSSDLDTKSVVNRWTELDPPEELDLEDIRKIGYSLIDSVDAVLPKNAVITRFEAENFFSYETVEYNVEEGIWLILGESDDYESNGAGKSTFVEIPYWGLTGKTTKGVNADEVVRWGTKQATVKLYIDLYKNNKVSELVIERTRTKDKHECTFTIDGEPQNASGVVELQKTIESSIGITPETYKALGYFSQSDLLLFSEAKDAERKNILADICGLTAYAEASTQAGKVAKEKLEEVSKVEFGIESVENVLLGTVNDIEEVQDNLVSWNVEHKTELDNLYELRERLDQEQIEFAKRQSQLNQISEIKDHLINRAKDTSKELFEQIKKRKNKVTKNLKLDIEEYRNKEHELGEALDKLRVDFSIESQDVEIENLEKKKEGYESAKDKLKDKQYRISAKLDKNESIEEDLVKQRSNWESLEPGEPCPKCGSPVKEEDLGQEISSIDKKIEELNSKNEKYENQLEKFSVAIREIDVKIDDVKATIANVRKNEKKYHTKKDVLTKEISKVKDKIKELEDRFNESIQRIKEESQQEATKYLNDRIEILNNRNEAAIKFYNKTVESYSNQIERLEDKIKLTKNKDNPYKEELERLHKHKESLEKQIEGKRNSIKSLKEKALIYQYWNKGFSKKGVQSLFLDEIANMFNENRSAVVPLITGGKYDVQFSTVSETASGELRERTDFVIHKGDREVSYNSLSGGQRRRIDLSVLLTLTIAVSKAYNIQGTLGMMALDEVFDFLDADGTEALYEALNAAREVIPSFYVVTQDKRMQGLFPNSLLITQDENGVSEVQA